MGQLSTSYKDNFVVNIFKGKKMYCLSNVKCNSSAERLGDHTILVEILALPLMFSLYVNIFHRVVNIQENCTVEPSINVLF